MRNNQNWIPKSDPTELQKFQGLVPEISVSGNGILLKNERIILPEYMQKGAIELAHQGAHTGESGLKGRLRYHFFFHGMHEKVVNHIKGCLECNMLVDKKTKEPTKSHKIPTNN